MSDMIKVGDKVRFLSSTGGGVVSGFRGKDIVLVEDEDGFEIPTLRREVVVVDTDDYNIAKVHTSASTGGRGKNKPVAATAGTSGSWPKGKAMGATKNSSPASKPATDKDDDDERPVTFRAPVEERKGGDQLSAYLAFVPIDLHEVTKTAFEAYLVNDCNYYLRFAYYSAEGNSYRLRATGEVEPNTKVFIEEFGREQLGELERVAVQLLAYKRDKSFLLKPAVDVQLRIDGTKFYKLHTFQDNDFFEQPALVYTLVENDRIARPLVIDAQRLKSEMYGSGKTDRQGNPTTVHPNDNTYVRRYEDRRDKQGNPFVVKRRGDEDVLVVDLHIGELLDTTAGLSAADMLQYQLKKFHEVMAANAGKKGQRIVFIHGKGDGVLRHAIVNELNYRYKQHSYQDASFQEYGYGATQVTIK